MVDDYAARQCAKTLGIATLGTGGMLVLAKRRGIISSVQPALIAVRRAGLWLSEEVVSLLLTQAGEN
jgi:predicted nucleic acid-binding protein